MDDHFVPVGQWEAQIQERQDREEAEQRLEDEQRLEWDIVRRIQGLNSNHASQAWENRFRMPLSAHALAFLFHQLDARGAIVVKASTKVWLAGVPDGGQPVRLIGALIGEVRQQLANAQASGQGDSAAVDGRGREAQRGRRSSSPSTATAWDVRTELCDRSDDGMALDAVYAGLGYSTLDTAAGSFAQVCQSAGTQLEVPGAFCYVSNPSGKPDDHRVLTAERAAVSDFGTTTIHTHGALSTRPFSSPYPYTSVDLPVFYSDQWPYCGVLHAMWQLDQLLRVADLRRHQAPSAGVEGRS